MFHCVRSLTCAKGYKDICRKSCGKRLQCSGPSPASCCSPDGGFSRFCPKFVPYESAVDGFSAKNGVCRGFAACVVPNKGGVGPLGSLESASTSERAVCWSVICLCGWEEGC